MAKRVFVEKAKRFLKKILQEPELREYVLKELSTYFADKEKTEDNIEKLYRQLVKIGDEQDERSKEKDGKSKIEDGKNSKEDGKSNRE